MRRKKYEKVVEEKNVGLLPSAVHLARLTIHGIKKKIKTCRID